MSSQDQQHRKSSSQAGAIVKSSAYVGGGAAALGSAFAAGHATLHGHSAVLWGAAGGAQCFVLGSTFWFTRSVLRNSGSKEGHLPRQEDLVYSTLAGCFAGMAGGALRGRGNIIPGAIVLGLMGLGGQASSSAFAAMADAPRESRPILDRLSDSKWWPLKSISDEDYEKDLTEKMIGLEAEIAIIDDRITSLKQDLASGNST